MGLLVKLRTIFWILCGVEGVGVGAGLGLDVSLRVVVFFVCFGRGFFFSFSFSFFGVKWGIVFFFYSWGMYS